MFSKKPSSSDATSRGQDAKPMQSPLFDKPSERPVASAPTTPQAKITTQGVPGNGPAGVGKPMPPRPVVNAAPATSTITPPSPLEKDQGMSQQPPKPAAPGTAPSFRTDFRPEGRAEPARRVDLSGVAAPRSSDAEPVRKLIVGRDISLNGEINACDYLVVEGTVEARVREGKRIEITDAGLFRGTVEIEEADIAGRFEGDITVRGRLRVRSTGRIEGKIQYGELEVEAGGQLEGDVRGLKPVAPIVEKTAKTVAQPVATPRPIEPAPVETIEAEPAEASA